MRMLLPLAFIVESQGRSKPFAEGHPRHLCCGLGRFMVPYCCQDFLSLVLIVGGWRRALASPELAVDGVHGAVRSEAKKTVRLTKLHGGCQLDFKHGELAQRIARAIISDNESCLHVLQDAEETRIDG